MAVWKRLAYADELLTLSKLEQSLGENLMPADGFTSVHLGGLFDSDENGDLMPGVGTGTDTFCTLDAADDIQPGAQEIIWQPEVLYHE